MKYLLLSIKNVFSNKVTLIFAAGHWIFIILALVDNYIDYGTLSNILGHTNSQTSLITFLMYINLPVVLVSIIVSLFFGWIFASTGLSSARNYSGSGYFIFWCKFSVGFNRLRCR